MQKGSWQCLPNDYEFGPKEPFTSSKYTGLFLEAGARFSMDHRGRAYDNIFIEHLWRNLKYEDIYLRDYQYPREARKGIYRYMEHYNHKRFH